MASLLCSSWILARFERLFNQQYPHGTGSYVMSGRARVLQRWDEPGFRSRNLTLLPVLGKAGKISLPSHFKMPWVSSHKASSECLVFFGFCSVFKITQHGTASAYTNNLLLQGLTSWMHPMGYTLWSAGPHSQLLRTCVNTASSILNNQNQETT